MIKKSIAWQFSAKNDVTVKLSRKVLNWCSVKLLTKDHKIKKETITGISNVGKIKVKCYENVYTSKTTLIRD